MPENERRAERQRQDFSATRGFDGASIRGLTNSSSAGSLAAATAAHAECGWVLWNDEVRLDYAELTEVRLWHTIAGAPTKRECEARLREEIEHVMRADTRPQGVQFKAQGDAVQLTYLR